MNHTNVLVWAFAIGVLTGLRSLTTPAVTAWAAHLGWLRVESPLRWLETLPAAIVFTLAAAGEVVADKLPKTPSRTAPVGLIARVVMGGMCGGALYSAGSNQGLWAGVAVGVVGAIVGTYGGYQARTRLVKALGVPDYVVAVAEDLVAIGGSFFLVTRL